MILIFDFYFSDASTSFTPCRYGVKGYSCDMTCETPDLTERIVLNVMAPQEVHAYPVQSASVQVFRHNCQILLYLQYHLYHTPAI